MVGFGQACQYGSSADASELCDFYQARSFATYRNADIALDKILDVTGMSKRFVLKECNDISNCLATTYKGIRYILYDREFMDAIATRTNSWSSMSILAHEIGHHVNGHTLGEESTLSESRQMEIEADEYSGFIMFKLGASLEQAQEAIRVYGSGKDDSYSTHPSKDKRLRAIEKGYNNAKGQSSNNDYATKSSKLTAEDYYYKAVNSSDYQDKIDNYTKCLKLDSDFSPCGKRKKHKKCNSYVYFNRGNAYRNSGNYVEAIADFTRAIKIDSDDADSYGSRGELNYKIENYEEALDDYNKAITLDPNNVNVFNNRGLLYAFLESYEDALNDYNKTISLDPNNVVVLENRGNLYYELKEYYKALSDFSSIIKIDPDYADAYYGRGIVYEALGKYEDGITANTIAIKINPNYARAYINRGVAKSNLGLPFCSDFKEGCKLQTDYCEYFEEYCAADLYINSGVAYMESENYEDAIADFTKAISIDPDYALAYKNRGVAKEYMWLSMPSEDKLDILLNGGAGGGALSSHEKPYCSDWKKACDLGEEQSCEWYSEQCR